MPPLQLFFDPLEGIVLSCCYQAFNPKNPLTSHKVKMHLRSHDTNHSYTFDGDHVRNEIKKFEQVLICLLSIMPLVLTMQLGLRFIRFIKRLLLRNFTFVLILL